MLPELLAATLTQVRVPGGWASKKLAVAASKLFEPCGRQSKSSGVSVPRSGSMYTSRLPTPRRRRHPAGTDTARGRRVKEADDLGPRSLQQEHRSRNPTRSCPACVQGARTRSRARFPACSPGKSLAPHPKAQQVPDHESCRLPRSGHCPWTASPSKRDLASEPSTLSRPA